MAAVARGARTRLIAAALVPTPVHPHAVRRVVVTGSESTGKTTLAADLAGHYGTVWVAEFAREYLDRKLGTTGASLGPADVEPIARGQIAAEERALAGARGLLVLDTDVVSTVVYARHYYGSCPEWIERAARDRLADLYLLCDIDVPWTADAQRDRPDARPQLHTAFEEALVSLGARYVTLRGPRMDRLSTAVAAIDAAADR